ncbi:MAG: hypothetical protein LBT30_05340 [Clostridiales bacterium]|jgi:uncharacterized membrane protein|nr:hypothetical protein [Clostridiales bacterium]
MLEKILNKFNEKNLFFFGFVNGFFKACEGFLNNVNGVTFYAECREFDGIETNFGGFSEINCAEIMLNKAF